MARRSVYTVNYRMYESAKVQSIDVVANSKADAYDIAVFEEIPKIEDGDYPYSAWVESVTYANGNYHLFNTVEGLPY